ncbi:hypothetical protein OSB04_015634 [Centaurea solstitialis]|uniref:Alanine--tRNA ligase n=1 Tax=Centaurea solstitialis TaxID=347529 RepID=A0AA38T116_9ASTR|nr:hypothetical protein OSB04_015634 [Centaurea solstitialis]
MNQYKPIFLGTADPNTSLSKLTRACNTQKCIRAGGKHNDLEDVGKDTYHHTFFEMLGNWSFGDYFKLEAIGWAWELLTTVYKLPSDRIYATYFGGDEKLSLPADNEARDIWLKYLPPKCVLPFGCKFTAWTNLAQHTRWHMPPFCLSVVVTTSGRWVIPDHVDLCSEIHFDRIGDRDAAELVNDDDPTLIEIWNIVFIQATGAAPYSGKVGSDDADGKDMAYRVIADHIRTLSFAIADGSCPGNEGREYVLRLILRRAIRYGETLKAKQGFFNGFVKVVVEVMSDAFPELKQREEHIREIIAAEEISFLKTKQHDAFVLWDSFGYSLDLMQQGAAGAIVMDANATSALHERGISTTNDSFRFTWFQAIYTGKEYVETAAFGDEVGIILESTSFYAEQGGQIFDTGVLESPSGLFEVYDVQIYGGFVIHLGKFTCKFRVGDEVVCKEVLGNHIDQRGSIVLPEKLRLDFSHGKPVKPDELRKIESIVNEQIKAELDVSTKEAGLSDAKRVNGLRAVFGEGCCNGRKVEDLLSQPENEEWLSIFAELCGGTHISNTREAKAFAILSEEGIAKGIRRVTAITTDFAFEAIKRAYELEKEVDEASELEGSLLEQKVTYLNGKVESASIPTVKKADLKAKLSVFQNQVKKAKKKMAVETTQRVVEAATEAADVAASEGKAFCVSRVAAGTDAAAIRQAVVKVMEEKGIAVMVFSTDENAKKALVYAGVPETSNQLCVLEWLKVALEPIDGKGGRGKDRYAQGQGKVRSRDLFHIGGLRGTHGVVVTGVVGTRR